MLRRHRCCIAVILPRRIRLPSGCTWRTPFSLRLRLSRSVSSVYLPACRRLLWHTKYFVLPCQDWCLFYGYCTALRAIKKETHARVCSLISLPVRSKPMHRNTQPHTTFYPFVYFYPASRMASFSWISPPARSKPSQKHTHNPTHAHPKS